MMRLLERINVIITTGNSLAVDVAARGARGFYLTLQPASAGILNQLFVAELFTRPNMTTIQNRIAQWWYDPVDSQQPSYIFAPISSDTLFLFNSTGGDLEIFLVLYDEPPATASVAYTSFRRESTLAALATFTTPNMQLARYGQSSLVMETDRAADLFVDCLTTSALNPIELQQNNIAAAGGGVAQTGLPASAPLFRLRIRNNDAALLMTYTMTMYTRSAAA